MYESSTSISAHEKLNAHVHFSYLISLHLVCVSPMSVSSVVPSSTTSLSSTTSPNLPTTTILSSTSIELSTSSTSSSHSSLPTTALPSPSTPSSNTMARRMVWKNIATPAALLQTTFGQPHNILTDMLTSLPKSYIPLAGIRYSHFYDHDTAIQLTNKANLSTYCNLPNIQSMVLLRDPAYPQQLEANDTTVTIQTWAGRRKVTPQQYMKSIEISKPHFAVNFHDEIFPEAGHNRTRACVERCVHWFHDCIKLHHKSIQTSTSNNTQLLAFLPCITDQELRTKSIQQILDIAKKYNILPTSDTSQPSSSPLGGFVLGCLGLGENYQQRNSTIKQVLSMLPSAGIRVLSGIGGSGGPADVLAAINQGIDIIDSDYPQVLTQYGYASTFIYDISTFLHDTSDTSSTNHHKRDANTAELDEHSIDHTNPSKRSNIESSITTNLPSPSRNIPSIVSSDPTLARKIQQSTAKALQSDITTKINLYDKMYAEDAQPLVSNCLCFACSGIKAYTDVDHHEYPVPPLRPTKDQRPLQHPGHTRSYVHHLLNTHEMLADVLLSIHNTYHYAAFFAAIRQAIELNKFTEYSHWFLTKNNLQ